MKAFVIATSMALSGLVLPAQAAVEPVRSVQQPAVWEFDVFLDDKPIGSHQFRLVKEEESLQISSEASFDVRILLVNVFSYRHESTERWQDDCLREFQATTRQNKKQFVVSGEASTNAFLLNKRIDGEADKQPLSSECVKSFAYWNKSILLENKLLNNQTGDYQQIEVRDLGPTTIAYNGEDLRANQYALATPKGDIKLWYEQATSRWLALEAPAKGDRVIRYEPSRLPDAVIADADWPQAKVRYDF